MKTLHTLYNMFNSMNFPKFCIFFAQYMKKDANCNVIEAVLSNFDETIFFYKAEFQSSITCMFIILM